MTKKRRRSDSPVTIPEPLARRLERRVEQMTAAGAEGSVIDREVAGILHQAGIDAGRINALLTTRVVLTPSAYARLPADERAAWDALVADGRAQLKKVVPLTPELREAIREQEEAFRTKFGRPMGPGDPIFFDPSADTPQPINAEVVEQVMSEAMHAAGIDPAKIYAMQKTGFMPVAGKHRLSPAERREWIAAVREGQRLYPDWPSRSAEKES
jgi:hypothetical protein